MPNSSQHYAFEPFGSVESVMRGDPIRIMPLGVFYRGERKLSITAEDLKEIAANHNSGLPRFRVPINENHSGVGKVGTVQAVEYVEMGADGPGLYATQYELTDEGKKLIQQKRYDAVSPEIVWSKNGGAKYQDPETGKLLDNVLVGLALTDKPFFGHDNVSLFSAEVLDPKPKRNNGYTALKAMMRQKFDELMAMVTDSDGDGEPDMPPMLKGKVETASVPTADTPAEPHKEITMIQPVTPPIPAPESFSVSKDEFEALKTQAAEAANLKEQFTALKTQSETFATQLTETRRARRRDQLVVHCENFSALPDKVETLAEKLQALEEKDPDLFKYFDELLNVVNNQIMTAGLFSQKASARTGGQPETFEAHTEKVLKDKFGGDMSKYSEALSLAAKERPDLFAVYNETYAPSRK